MALKAAIETATSVFNDVNDAAQLLAALQALADAETIHTIGQGDLTRLGKNMSFEDLSSQDGNTTSGVAAPPSGWTLLVNGKQVTSISEENAAGLNAWAGINGDGTGAKEGCTVPGHGEESSGYAGGGPKDGGRRRGKREAARGRDGACGKGGLRPSPSSDGNGNPAPHGRRDGEGARAADRV